MSTKMTGRSLGRFGSGLLLIAVASASHAAATHTGGESWRLASAQIVASEQAPPILKLTANGPIAFERLASDEAGVPSTASRVIARLHGVAPGDLATLTTLAPFVVTVRPAGNDSIVTIEVASLPAAHALVLRAARRTNELEAVIAAAP